MISIDIKKKLSELNLTELQYEECLKDLSDCKNGITDLSWEDVKHKYSLPYHSDTLRKCNVSIFGASDVLEYYRDKGFGTANLEYLQELQTQKDELYKVKKQLFDQRREYNNLRNPDARTEHLMEYIKDCADNLQSFVPLNFRKTFSKSTEKDVVLVFADWHYGLVTDNIWNTYSPEICKQRVEKLIERTISQINLHNPKRLHILLLGDAAHGAIHTGCRVASDEDTCDQIMHVAEIMAEAIHEVSLCESIEETLVYSTYGNHLRTIQDKKDSAHSDNMEKLIPWWLKQRLYSRQDIRIVDSEYEEFIKLNVCGYNICATHGDLDKIKNLGVTVNTIFSKKFGETIDYTISADKHHLEEFESFDIESILVRSLCGTDQYANGHRLYSSPGQTLMFFTAEDGRDTTCNIKFS